MRKINELERDPRRLTEFTNAPPRYTFNPSEFELAERQRSDFAELRRADFDPLTYIKVALVQEIRRRPRLRETIEKAARKLGREIDLTKRQGGKW